jgi:hypothetical protein
MLMRASRSMALSRRFMEHKTVIMMATPIEPSPKVSTASRNINYAAATDLETNPAPFGQ